MDNVRQAVREADLTFPILIDQDKRNWDAWGNSMWPSVYLIDPRGDIRFWWYGELNWKGADGAKRLRQRIEELLDAGNKRGASPFLGQTGQAAQMLPIHSRVP